jgi:hypothetical protein
MSSTNIEPAVDNTVSKIGTSAKRFVEVNAVLGSFNNVASTAGGILGDAAVSARRYTAHLTAITVYGANGVKPSATGLPLGDSTHRFNGFLNTLNVLSTSVFGDDMSITGSLTVTNVLQVNGDIFGLGVVEGSTLVADTAFLSSGSFSAASGTFSGTLTVQTGEVISRALVNASNPDPDSNPWLVLENSDPTVNNHVPLFFLHGDTEAAPNRDGMVLYSKRINNTDTGVRFSIGSVANSAFVAELFRFEPNGVFTVLSGGSIVLTGGDLTVVGDTTFGAGITTFINPSVDVSTTPRFNAIVPRLLPKGWGTVNVDNAGALSVLDAANVTGATFVGGSDQANGLVTITIAQDMRDGNYAVDLSLAEDSANPSGTTSFLRAYVESKTAGTFTIRVQKVSVSGGAITKQNMDLTAISGNIKLDFSIWGRQN